MRAVRAVRVSARGRFAAPDSDGAPTAVTAPYSRWKGILDFGGLSQIMGMAHCGQSKSPRPTAQQRGASSSSSPPPPRGGCGRGKERGRLAFCIARGNNKPSSVGTRLVDITTDWHGGPVWVCLNTRIYSVGWVVQNSSPAHAIGGVELTEPDSMTGHVVDKYKYSRPSLLVYVLLYICVSLLLCS